MNKQIKSNETEDENKTWLKFFFFAHNLIKYK